jgi:SAM-dependent methyltransferase
MRLLDVSCGTGQLLRSASILWDLDVYGIDISRVALMLTGQCAPGARLIQCDGAVLPFRDCTFEYITNLGSLEHYTDALQGIREMARVLTAGGRLAILLPNSYYLVDILWRVLRTGYGPSHGQLVERFATAGEWKDMLTEGGIQVLGTHAYNLRFPTTMADWAWYRLRPGRIARLLVGPFLPFNLSYCFLFVGRKARSRV